MRIDSERIIKNILYIILLCAIFILQSTYNLLPQIKGYEIDILATVFVAIAVLDNVSEAVLIAFLTGFLYDLNFFPIQGVTSLIFMFSAIFIFFSAKKYFSPNIITNMMFTSIALLTNKVILFALYYIFIDQTSFLIYFQTISAEIIISTLLCPITFFAVKIISKKFKSRLGGFNE